MKYRLIEKTLTPVSITAAANSEWFDVGGQGCDSIAMVMVATAASSPNTATIQLVGSLDKSALVNVGSSVSVAANGTFSVSADRPVFRYYRLAYAIASGSYTSTLSVLAKGDKE